ncbi:hypothetical protein BGX21_007408, partial [Mortierella sp. AD011]
MVHRYQREQKKDQAVISKRTTSPQYITNAIAWKHIVQSWNLVKAVSISNCFRHVPIFNEHQNLQLMTLSEDDQDVSKVLSSIQDKVSRVNRERPDETVEKYSDNPGVLEDIVNKDQDVIVEDPESMRVWVAEVADEDGREAFERMGVHQQMAVIIPTGDATTLGSSISEHGDSASSVPQALYGAENITNLPSSDQERLLTHIDTHKL